MNWVEKVESHYYDNNDQCVVLLIAPPGTGKTHHVKAMYAAESRKKVWLDCSNDELVERAMSAILSERFPSEGENSLLVADEYHMLTEEHKNDLLNWIRYG